MFDFRTYYRGWRIVSQEEYETVTDMLGWYADRADFPLSHWRLRQLQYLQQRLDEIDLFA